MGNAGYQEDPGIVQVIEDRKYTPRSWKKPKRIFVNSMSDTFHPHIPTIHLLDLFIEMWLTRHHTYQVLTKRPGRAAAWYKNLGREFGDWVTSASPQVQLGTSVETQKYAPRIEVLARTEAPVKFVSAEPLLGELDLTKYMDAGQIQWLIVGGESGPRARPMDLDWARDLRDQAVLRGIPFFLKQLGGRGDKRGGDKAVLDGRTWQEFPK